MELPCGPAASQSSSLERIAPRLSPRSAAGAPLYFPAINSTTRAPIARACASPASRRAWAASSVCPCRSSVKSGSIAPRPKRRSQCESSPLPVGASGGGGAARRGLTGEGFGLTGRVNTGGALPSDEGVVATCSALGMVRPAIGVTVAATFAQIAASSAVSPRGGFTGSAGARASPWARISGHCPAYSSRLQFGARLRRHPRRYRNGWSP